jgi:hypothetical protein
MVLNVVQNALRAELLKSVLDQRVERALRVLLQRSARRPVWHKLEPGFDEWPDHLLGRFADA